MNRTRGNKIYGKERILREYSRYCEMSFLICSSIGLRLYDYKLLLPHMNKYATVAVLLCHECVQRKHQFSWLFFNKRNFRFPNVYLLITSKYNSPLKPQVCMFHQKYKQCAYIVDCECCECLTRGEN